VLGTSLGNYRVVQQLSEGGMGVVYIGHHEALGRRVVVKVLQPELPNDADMVQRFDVEPPTDRCRCWTVVVGTKHRPTAVPDASELRASACRRTFRSESQPFAHNTFSRPLRPWSQP
jgi:serine/threonine protein kinase